MKFKTNDIIENRNGTQVQIKNADVVAKEYHYKYLNTISSQFQGMFCHSADDIELHWVLSSPSSYSSLMKKVVGQTLVVFDEPFEGLDEFQSCSRLNRQGQSCIHEMVTYVGFTEIYKYCKKCDEKFPA